MIFIAGIPTAGKTFYTTKHFEKNYSVDYVYVSMAEEMGVERAEAGNLEKYKDLTDNEFYQLKRKHYYQELPRDVEVFEGYGLCFKDDRDLICEILGNDYTLFFLNVNYQQWLQYRKQPDTKQRRAEFNKLNNDIEFPEDYFLLDPSIDLTIAIKDYPLIATYQNGRGKYGKNFIDEKYQRLNIDPKGKSIVDIGGNAGKISQLALENGAKSALVIDINWLLLKECQKSRKKGIRTALLDIKNLKNIKEKFDISICASTLHYFKDQEKVISDISNLTKELFVLEMPVSQTGAWLIDSPKGTYKPPKEVVLQTLCKYFKNCWIDGESVAPDDSYRLVFKAIK